MRKRRKSIASWLFLFVGLLLVLGVVVAALPLLVDQSWLNPEMRGWLENLLETRRRVLPTEDQVRYLAWLAGIAVSALSAALTLLASWHFAEMNLPQRLKELKETHTRDHLSLQPDLLVLARRGLGPVAADIERSRLTLLRKWVSGWSKKEQARVLAASSNQLAREASALSAAARVAQQQQITAHLIRGYQYASQNDDEKAFEEFEAATKVRADDIISRDIAAGWARRTNKQRQERELLAEMQDAAIGSRSEINQARALRREAELLDKGQNETDWRNGRDKLDIAYNVLLPVVADQETRLELGRILTLFCEVQCNRKRVGHLDSRLARMRTHVAGVAMHMRPEEPDGEKYGEKRANDVSQRVVELRGDPDAES